MFWELPGPRRFVAEILDSLESQRHSLVSLPRAIGRRGFHRELELGLRGRALGELTILSTDGAKDDLLDLLDTRLGWRAATVEDLLEDSRRPSRFVLLEDSGACTVQEAWKAFLRRAASHTQVLGRSEVQFVIVASGTGELPNEDVFLSVHRWWGRLNQLDVDWATEYRLTELPPPSVADRYWIRALCRAFAACDPVLACALVETCPKDLTQLKEMTAGLEWPDYKLSLSSAEVPRVSDRLRLTALPADGPIHRLWSEGALDWQEDLGPVVLTRAVVALGDEEELRRRLWRGQLEIFMPLVERARLEVSGYLERTYGGDWEEILCQRAGLAHEDTVSSEIGGLAKMAGALKHSGHALPSLVRRVIFGWRDIRNDLAHWRPVAFESLEQAVEASDKLLLASA